MSRSACDALRTSGGECAALVEPERSEVRTQPVERRCRLERLPQCQYRVFSPWLADDLHADKKPADQPGRLRESTEAEIVDRPREIARDRRCLVDLFERNRGYRHRGQQNRVVLLEPCGKFAPTLCHHAQI